MRVAFYKTIQLIESNPPKLVFVNDFTGEEFTAEGHEVRSALCGAPNKKIIDFMQGCMDSCIQAMDYFSTHL